MDAAIKILTFLLNNKENKFTIKKISEAVKINYRIAYEQIIELEKDHLIKITKVGNSKLCELTYYFSEMVFTAEYERRKTLLKNKDFLVLHNHLKELRFPYIVLLFGSWAKGNENKHSDVDILTIGGDEKAIKTALSLLPDKIHLTSISYLDFLHMARSKEFTVVSEAIKNNIILIGIEEYYRMLENAR